MKFSIVTLAYNKYPYLSRCVLSILGQARETELVIVDPGSTDGGRQYVQAIADQHPEVHLVTDLDEGPADGLNHGFARASGEWLGFVNGDDFLLPRAIVSARHFVRDVPYDDPTLLLGSGWHVGEGGVRIRPMVPTRRLTAAGYMSGLHEFVQPATFFNRAAFDLVGGFNARNLTCWDTEFFLFLVERGARVIRTRRYLAAFRATPEGISQRSDLGDQRERDLDDLAHRLGVPRRRSRRALKLIEDPLRTLQRATDAVRRPTT